MKLKLATLSIAILTATLPAQAATLSEGETFDFQFSYDAWELETEHGRADLVDRLDREAFRACKPASWKLSSMDWRLASDCADTTRDTVLLKIDPTGETFSELG